jgi:hypothetical protein
MSLMWKAVLTGASILASGLAQANGAINTDVTQTNIQQTICVPGYTKTIRPSTMYTNGVKQRLLREAGINQSRISDYELDHIIPLAIGGHPRKLANLQLQLWEGEDGAKRKDRIEVKLQCLVCTEQISLGDAQHEISDSWQNAYHQYALVKCKRPSRPGSNNMVRSAQY